MAGVLLLLTVSKVFRFQDGLIKRKEPKKPYRGCLTKYWQPVVLQLMEQLGPLDSGYQEDVWQQQAVKSAQQRTGPQVAVASKPHSQLWSLTPVLIFPLA